MTTTVGTPKIDATPVPINPAVDEELTLRAWSGQRPRMAAREMGMSLQRYLARQRRLEIPHLSCELLTDTFEPARAQQNIKALQYRREQCRAYREQGVEFFFWRPVRGFCHYSRSAKLKPWFATRQAKAEAQASVAHNEA